MAEPLEGAFADALKDGRPRYNALFAQARRSAPTVTPEAFASLLRDYGAPIVDVAVEANQDRLRAVADAVVELSLELLARDLPARCPAVLDGWRLLAELPRQVAAEPVRLIGSITNGIYNLSQVPGTRPAEWVERMRELGNAAPDTTLLLDAGRVAAWRCGMAHYRQAALELCDRLDESLVRTALAIPADSPITQNHLTRQLRRDPWAGFAPSDGPMELKVARRVGGFRGFGGPFIRPPMVSTVDGQIAAGDGERWWWVHADSFGTAFVRGGVGPLPAPDSQPPGFSMAQGGVVRFAGLDAQFLSLQEATSAAAACRTLAVTVQRSHRITLIAPGCDPE